MFDEGLFALGMEFEDPGRGGGSHLSISPTFGPPSLGSTRPSVDTILLSNDSILFYVDEATLLRVSSNSFKGLLPLTMEDKSQRILFMRDISSSELDIMLQAIYNLPSTTAPAVVNIQVLLSAVDRFLEYGISATGRITPTSHFYQYLLACAPLHPLEVYALAAQHDMKSLATTASAHTLVVELSQISEEMSKRMGSIYLLRLFQLHAARTETLKKLLAADFEYHNTTSDCDIRNQRQLKNGWNLAVASMLFTIKPDTTTTAIRDAIVKHTSDLTCPDCVKLRDSQLTKIISEWAIARRTIGV